MTTPSEAAEVLRHTTLCHRRTAIRPANETEAKAIAIIWAKIFSRHDFTLQQLLTAVERRAETEPTAPEPAEIITTARQLRRETAEREKATNTTDTNALTERRKAIRACNQCDPNGWIEINGTAHRCTHGQTDQLTA